MYLKRLRVKNYRSIGDIEVSFTPKGVIVVDGINFDVDGGANAAGKTSLLSSIPFALFGRPLEGGSLSEYVRYGEDNLQIEVELQVNDKAVLVKRSLDNFDLVINGKSLKGLKSSLTKEFIYQTGLTYQALKALFLGQAWESFVDLTPAKRVDSLENVFSIFIFDELIQKFKCRKKEFEQKIVRLEKRKSHIEGILSSTKHSYEAKISEFEEKRKRILATLDTKINQLKVELNVFQTQLSKTENLPSLEELESKIRILEKKQDQLNQEFLQLEGEYKTLKTELYQLKSQIARLNYDIQQLDQNICPTCNRPINSPELLLKKKQERQRLYKKAKEISARLEDLKKQHLIISEQKGSIGDELSYLRGKHRSLQQEILTRHNLQTKVAQFHEKLDSLLSERKRVLEEENPYTLLEEERKQRFNQATKEYMQVVKKINTAKKMVEYVTVWLDVIKKTRSFLFLEMLAFLESKANKYLEYLYPDLRIKFTYKEGKLLLVLIKENQETSFKLLSGGEQQLVRLACLLGLFETVRVRVLGSIQFMILDEPLQHLDEVKRQKFSSLLKDLGKDLQIIVIDHHADAFQDPQQYILIEKRNGVSILKENRIEAPIC